MPELPEVETVRRGLEPALINQVFTRVRAHRRDLRFPLPERFEQQLTGRRVEALRRRGKFLLLDLSDAQTLLMHLGMTGRFTVTGAAPAQPSAAAALARHTHVVFETASARVEYSDPRRFGFMRLFPAHLAHQDPSLRTLGVEPLSEEFTLQAARAALSKSAAPLKSALLDQSKIAGLGNIYVCEALHRAKVSPLRAANSLSDPELRRLRAAIIAVLTEAIAAGGSTLRDYAAADGALGYFQHGFRVYGRAGEPCLRRNCAGLVTRAVQAGRSTFACPACQT